MAKHRAIKRVTENQSDYQAALKRGKTELRQGLADILRAELAVLLDEHTRQLSIEPLLAPDGSLFFDAVKQNHDYIRAKMIQRLQSTMGENAPTAWQIDHYLAQVASIMQAKEARGEDVSALPYVNKTYFTAQERTKPEAKQRGKKRQPKRGKKRPVMINGTRYSSVTEASEKTPYGYDYIQRHTLANPHGDNKL